MLNWKETESGHLPNCAIDILAKFRPRRKTMFFLSALSLLISWSARAEENLLLPPSRVPTLEHPAAYEPDGDTITVELSQYAGYAGLVLANGGLEPTENSFFFKNYHFKVKFTLSEEESWPALNSGKMAASATTVDVLAAYGKQFNVIVPALISFSRGADGIVLQSDVKDIRDLAGKTVVVSKFTESDFFMRYLADKNGLLINMRQDLRDPPDPNKLNLVFAARVDDTTKVFEASLRRGKNELAGCVGWAPMTTDLVQKSKGRAYIETTNRNQLIIADILVVNRGFAEKHPEMVKGLVHGLLEGNRLVDEVKKGKSGGAALDLLAKAFTTDPKDAYDRDSMRGELGKVDLSNYPLNSAFFEDKMPLGGSFDGIYQEAVRCYGKELIDTEVDPSIFVDQKYLKEIGKIPEFAHQVSSIGAIPGPIPNKLASVVRKNVRFVFDRNQYDQIDPNAGDNRSNLEFIGKFVRVSPGSLLKLIGHIDDTNAKAQGKDWAKKYSPLAVNESLKRAATIKKILVENYALDPSQIETDGKGWNEPLGSDPEQNRRVEVQIFSLE
jgi:NitT/TauT family transport system substrate-binding protein